MSELPEGVDVALFHLHVKLRGGTSVTAGPMSIGVASSIIRQWYQHRLFLRKEKTPEDLSTEYSKEELEMAEEESIEWLNNGTYAYNIGFPGTAETFCQAAWVMSDVVGMYIGKAPEPQPEGDEWKSR